MAAAVFVRSVTVDGGGGGSVGLVRVVSEAEGGGGAVSGPPDGRSVGRTPTFPFAFYSPPPPMAMTVVAGNNGEVNLTPSTIHPPPLIYARNTFKYNAHNATSTAIIVVSSNSTFSSVPPYPSDAPPEYGDGA